MAARDAPIKNCILLSVTVVVSSVVIIQCFDTAGWAVEIDRK